MKVEKGRYQTRLKNIQNHSCELGFSHQQPYRHAAAEAYYVEEMKRVKTR